MEQPPPEVAAEFQLTMSEEEAERFFAICENPPEPTQEMRDMMKEVMKWFKD